MEERTGEAFEFDEKLTVVGSKLKPGMKAPSFKLDSFSNGSLRQVNLSDSTGKVRLLNIVNSLDTPVCHVETQRWEKIRNELPADVVIYTISMDLPFAQSRWQNNENVSHEMLSSHRDETFGKEYGVLIKEWRLLQRAVLVIDESDTIVHAEYVPDQMAEPNYDETVKAVKNAAGG